MYKSKKIKNSLKLNINLKKLIYLIFVVGILMFINPYIKSVTLSYPCQPSMINFDGIIKEYKDENGRIWYYLKPGSSAWISPDSCNVVTYHCGNTATIQSKTPNKFTVSSCEIEASLIKVNLIKVVNNLSEEQFIEILKNYTNPKIFPIDITLPDKVTGYDGQQYQWNDIYLDPKSRCYEFGNYKSRRLNLSNVNCQEINETSEYICGYSDVIEKFMYETIYNYFENQLNGHINCESTIKQENNITNVTQICKNYKLKNIIESTTAKIVYNFSIVTKINITLINSTTNNTINITTYSRESYIIYSVNFEKIFQQIGNNFLSSEYRDFACINLSSRDCFKQEIEAPTKFRIPKPNETSIRLYFIGSYPTSTIIIDSEETIFLKISSFLSIETKKLLNNLLLKENKL
ncbi:MAG: hypothetical protein QW197_03265 [Candidatus Aenigmatarchaeota archaeon]